MLLGCYTFFPMIKKTTLFAITLFIGLAGAQAQKVRFSVPDYKKIEKTLHKKPESYPILLDRLNANDTTLSLSDYHFLYYGYILQPGYSNSQYKALSDSLQQLIQKETQDETEFSLIAQTGSRLLKTNPFELGSLDQIIYAYRMLGNNAMAEKLEIRFGRIIETIFNSGDGLSKEKAFYVISMSNAKDMLRALGFGYAGQQMSVGPNLYYYKVDKNDFGIEGMYFYVPAKRTK